MKKLKEKYITLCNKVKLYLCELKKKDIKFSVIVKFLFKILALIFLFCVLATTIFKSCSSSNKNVIEVKKQLKSEVREIEDLPVNTLTSNDDFKIDTWYLLSNVQDLTTLNKFNNFIFNGFICIGDTFNSIPTEYICNYTFESGSFYFTVDLNESGSFGSWTIARFYLYNGNLSSYENHSLFIKFSELPEFFPNAYRCFSELTSLSGGDCPPVVIPWCYDGSINGIYKFSDILLNKESIMTLFFDFSSNGGYFNEFMVNNGVLYYVNNDSSEIYQAALFNEHTNKWEFTREEDKYINLLHFQNENDSIQFDLQLIKSKILQNISFEQFQQEMTKSGFELGVDICQSTNNSIVLFFTELFQLPYMLFTTLFSPFTFELGGISINLGATLLGLMLVLLIVWVMKKFK